MILAVTPGDPSGIGPEILVKLLRRRRTPPGATLLCFGAVAPFRRLGIRIVEVADPAKVRSLPRLRGRALYFVAAPTSLPKGRTQSPAALAGYQSGWAVATATRAVLDGHADAIVTGPISKERLNLGGFPYPGHTEFIASLCGEWSRKKGPIPVTMMLANRDLRVALVTTHLPLARVPGALTVAAITRATQHTASSLRDWWGLRRPRIAVCALNPHAGEGGLLGDEEQRVIAPAIRAMRRTLGKDVELSGPHPADTLFAQNHLKTRTLRYDAVVCMYHDQGLIPVKLLDFPGTVNLSLGLPLIRTSVDHGVAFDLVGTGRADPTSLEEALLLARRLVLQKLSRANRKES